MIIDADGTVLGRMASTAAAALKDGEEVHIVNAEKAVVTGRPEDTYERYRGKRERGNRDHGPHYPKAPDRIVKRTIKGMLPKSNDGRDMGKRLRTYRGNPDDLDADDVDVKTVDDLAGSRYVTIEEISDHI